MYLVLLGVLLLALKLLGVGPVWGWPWWAVLAPFGGAALWWAIADQTGITQRNAMRREEERTRRRRDAQAEHLGLKRPSDDRGRR
ncbi:TIGR04438 family Trp-rich protein [Aquabacterium sp. OR-4]|uniref:TIGR04438 family Trp-rich protein n=1 Tax=Aquabacterium sp. OR-4 TaxID=2978127 RepID=UPI0021B40FC3|nr:TIGR04438 family Trp-rich protein [Aquabacterium sp. OR-4]MDT7836759.1 TIGR04438 family Trp-rich protein [Aquabacterium sp. OR-4]